MLRSPIRVELCLHAKMVQSSGVFKLKNLQQSGRTFLGGHGAVTKPRPLKVVVARSSPRRVVDHVRDEFRQNGRPPELIRHALTDLVSVQNDGEVPVRSGDSERDEAPTEICGRGLDHDADGFPAVCRDRSPVFRVHNYCPALPRYGDCPTNPSVGQTGSFVGGVARLLRHLAVFVACSPTPKLVVFRVAPPNRMWGVLHYILGILCVLVCEIKISNIFALVSCRWATDMTMQHEPRQDSQRSSALAQLQCCCFAAPLELGKGEMQARRSRKGSLWDVDL